MKLATQDQYLAPMIRISWFPFFGSRGLTFGSITSTAGRPEDVGHPISDTRIRKQNVGDRDTERVGSLFLADLDEGKLGQYFKDGQAPKKSQVAATRCNW